MASTILTCRSGVSFVGRPPGWRRWVSAAIAEGLPAGADHVAPGRFELEHVAAAAAQLGRDHRRPGARERVDDIAAVVGDRAREQLDRFLGAVAAGQVRVERHLPDGGLAAVADPAGAGGAAYRVPAGLVAPVVVAAADRQVRLRPDDLRPQLEAGRFDRGRDGAGVEAG